MKLSWESAVENLRRDIDEVKSTIINAPFDSDFCNKMHLAKVALAGISARMAHAETLVRTEADSLRAEINAELRKMFAHTSELRAVISELNLIKAQRGRENYHHILELKRAAEEGGEL